MSSGSESDEEYVPGEPEQVSEEESADEETDLQYDKEQKDKAQKRKANNDNKCKKRLKTKTRNRQLSPEVEEEQASVTEKPADPEEEKKREEDLWAKFLEGTDTIPKTAPKENNVEKVNAKPSNDFKDRIKNSSKTEKDVEIKEKKIFEFAGETIIVEDNVIKEKIKTSEKPASLKNPEGPSFKGRSSGGISNILGQLNKKNKLSTLEKSKLDWDTYKKEAGVDEEVKSINKGKQGYLERQDFLERADMRQYEIERELRMTRRSNR